MVGHGEYRIKDPPIATILTAMFALMNPVWAEAGQIELGTRRRQKRAAFAMTPTLHATTVLNA